MGLTIIISKTKYIIISKTRNNMQLTLEDKQLQRVDKYKYLRGIINS